MLRFESPRPPRSCDGPSRRDFLRAGALGAGALGLSLADLARAQSAPDDRNCILLFLVGGPSQLDTFDPKPDAPAEVRGPFRPTRTSVPGIAVCEHLPQTAARADRFAIVRSLHHAAAPIHETGQQLMQTGRLATGGVGPPHVGAVLASRLGPRMNAAPPFVVLPRPVGDTGVSVSHGQGAGWLGSAFEPVSPDAVDAAHRAVDADPP